MLHILNCQIVFAGGSAAAPPPHRGAAPHASQRFKRHMRIRRQPAEPCSPRFFLSAPPPPPPSLPGPPSRPPAASPPSRPPPRQGGAPPGAPPALPWQCPALQKVLFQKRPATPLGSALRSKAMLHARPKARALPQPPRPPLHAPHPRQAATNTSSPPPHRVAAAAAAATPRRRGLPTPPRTRAAARRSCGSRR